MKRFFPFLITCLCLPILMQCNGQNKEGNTNPTRNNSKVGGDCEAGYCELMYYGMPTQIIHTDTSAGWFEKGQKLMVTGTVYKIDGRTPAPNVILYYHHTDNEGYYSPGDKTPYNSTRHGHIRGWVKTDSQGRYTIYSIRPGPYPGAEDPQHIHLIVKEPDIETEYWIHDMVFDDDPRLLPYQKKHPNPNPRCGSGILRVLLKDAVQIAEHDIVLGLNIPNYPHKNVASLSSGLAIGDEQPSFGPYHAYGPDKGTETCPVCKYGRYQGILFFVGNHPQWESIKSWLRFLEARAVAVSPMLKVYFIYGNSRQYNSALRQKQLENLGNELQLKKTALTYVPSFNDKKSDVHLNKINPDAENTFIIYRHRIIVDTFTNLAANQQNFDKINAALKRTEGMFNNLPEPPHH